MKSNILLVEASFIRVQLKAWLEKDGYKVYRTKDGMSVIDETFDAEVNLSGIDLILLDTNLPDVSVYIVLKFLNSKAPEIPVIIISSEKKKNTIIKLIDMGADDFLAKPLEASILLARVKKHLSVKEKDSLEDSREEKLRQSYEKQTKKDLENCMFGEIDRAIRSESSLVVMSISGNKESLNAVYAIAVHKLRHIDTIYFINNILIFILPVTDEEGAKIVKEKIFTPAGNDLDIKLKETVFPKDVSQELIDQYRIEKINQDFVARIFEK